MNVGTTVRQPLMGASAPRPEVPEGVHKKWLVLDFFAADCDLQLSQYKGLDNQELVGSDADRHIVAMIDVGPLPALLDESWSGARTYYITKDQEPEKINSPVLSEHGNKVDMTDRDVLRDFIVTNVKKFPADHIALILNDHGGGWTGVLEDDHDGALKKLGRISQVRQALEEAEKITGQKIDILGFDACYMADVQVAYEFKDQAKILLASEESESNKGWKYSLLLEDENSRTDSPEDFARAVVKANGQNLNDIQTFSGTRLDKMDALAQETANLAEVLVNSPERNAIRDAIRAAENYGGANPPYGNMRDDYHMADLLETRVPDEAVQQAARDVKEVLDQARIANVNGPQHKNSHGLHIYAPVTYKGVEADYKRLAFSQAVPDWAETLEVLGGHHPKKA